MSEKAFSERTTREAGKDLLRDLLTFQNPQRPLHEKIIKAAESGNLGPSRFLPTTYSQYWIDFVTQKPNRETEKQKHYFKKHLQNTVLVDLGGGPTSPLLGFARQNEVATYINVDRGPDLKKVADPNEPLQKKQEGKTQSFNVRCDMLDFASRLKSNSVNFMLNGINTSLIDSGFLRLDEDADYHETLAKELVRATRPGGLIMGRDSQAFLYLNDWIKEKSIPFKVIYPYGSISVFERTL